MKQLQLALIILLAALNFYACTDDDPSLPSPPPTTTGADGAFVLNQGNMYDGIAGTLDFLDFSTDAYTSGLFLQANGVQLGDTPQAGVVYGSRLYVAMYGSNLVWCIDAASGRIVRQIAMPSPEGICATDGYVYVSCNDGYLARIDTLSLEADAKRLEVGPNPAGVCSANGSVYVAISDGYNYANEYANGFRVVRVSTSDFSQQAEITVGMNPNIVQADAQGNIFAVCQGNYGMGTTEVKPEVWKITPDNSASTFVAATSIAVRENTLYTIYNYTNYTTNESTLNYRAYSCETGAVLKENLLSLNDLPAAPIGIFVNPGDGHIYVTGDRSVYDYNSPGYVYRYAPDGSLVKRYDAGSHPFAVVFK